MTDLSYLADTWERAAWNDSHQQLASHIWKVGGRWYEPSKIELVTANGRQTLSATYGWPDWLWDWCQTCHLLPKSRHQLPFDSWMNW